ncbi:MAG: peptidase S41, partial [Rikenellaceae bacterium]|nr:peptidase S41 [Rikenellaceae bacterium]
KIDTTQIPDSLKYRTLIKGRTVWGGGGIVPDITVPNDTTGYTKYYQELVAKGAVLQFIVGYMDKNRAKLETRYSTEDEFVRNFNIGKSELDMLVEYGEKNGAKFNQAEFEKSKAWIESIIKALIGERLFTKSTYYRIMNNSDSPMGKEFKAALKTFEN